MLHVVIPRRVQFGLLLDSVGNILFHSKAQCNVKTHIWFCKYVFIITWLSVSQVNPVSGFVYEKK